MVYLKEFNLLSEEFENGILINERRNYFHNQYPFRIFTDKKLEKIDFTNITILYGGNGSGKSTITLSDHGGKLDTTVLHDDAFIISNKDCSSISLEQSYFDKTQDYPLDNPQSKYFLTIQNCGATRNNEGKLVPVTEDICNGNGRTVKSVLATRATLS